jgi:hypothetical protein
MRRAYVAGGIRLRDFRVERNGKRDIDIIPAFTGTYAGGYLLTFDILPSGPSGPSVQIHSSGYYIDEQSNLRIYIPAADIRRRLPGESGYWSDAFVAAVFPVRERSHAITQRAAF